MFNRRLKCEAGHLFVLSSHRVHKFIDIYIYMYAYIYDRVMRRSAFIDDAWIWVSLSIYNNKLNVNMKPDMMIFYIGIGQCRAEIL